MNIHNVMETPSRRDDQAVLRFIERFAAGLSEAGMPRMPARVFAALLATDSGRLTAPELAALLQVSPAAVSGAVRYLAQLNMVSRERETGSRRDCYALHDDAWYEIVARRERLLERWQASAREGLEALGPASPAGMRLTEAFAFFDFLRSEMPTLLERWRDQRAGARPSSA